MRRSLPAAVAVVFATLAACSSVDPNAAVVNGHAIKVRDIEQDVAALIELNGTPDTSAPSTYPTDVLRRILLIEIEAELTRADLEANGVTVDPQAIAATDTVLGGANGFGERWSTAPAGVRRRLSQAQATLDAGTKLAGDADAFSTKMAGLANAATVVINARYGAWDPGAQTPIVSLVPRLTTR